ncbi:MAG: ABC transporter ATP-binding protein [Clostridia bacterium]|nr:ABC transporter ATP-binding protein [Clostridia bacterium]
MSKKNKSKETQHSMFSNIMFMLGVMFKLSPGLVIGELVNGVIRILPGRLISVVGIKYIIDVVSSGKELDRIYRAVALIALIIVLTKLVTLMFREFYWNMARERLYYRLNRQLYEKAKSLDLESYDDPDFYNNFILTIESSSENIQGILGMIQFYVGNIISFVTISSIIFIIDPWCLVIILAVVLAFMPVSRKISNLQYGRRVENTKFHRRSDYFQRIFYLQDYAKEVRMNNIQPLLLERYNDAANDVILNQKKFYKKISFFTGLQEIGVQGMGFMLILPLYLGYCVLQKGTLSAGDFVATFNGAYSIAMSINFLTIWAIARFSEQAKTIDKYRGFLKSDFKIKDGKGVANEQKPKTIEIKDLSFTYPGNDHQTLKNINLTIHPYEKIALVGYNGAGKTTLTNLLLRLYDASSGDILIDSVSIKDVSVASHRNRFSAVFQDFQTFACSVGENVALDADPDESRVLAALGQAGFSKALPKGTDTELLREFDDEGIMLSGGESQKVAIARAFYKNCPYIILDEPSANLDPIAEYNLNKAMVEAARNKTVIFISHRLSTTVIADRIYVMENGEIIESGSHAELMEKDGTYAKMFNLQAEKYKS